MMSDYQVLADKNGRIDKVLSSILGKSRNQIEKLIKEGMVSIDGKIVTKSSQQVSVSSKISYGFIQASPNEAVKIDFDVEILYEDQDMLVINKPSGLVVHPAPSVKGLTLVDWLKSKNIQLSTISGEQRHGIVHRIDKETTGALVIAKTNEAHEALSKQLQDKSMGRYYLAITDLPLKEHTRIDAPIARNPRNRLKMAIVKDGRNAKSDFLSLAQGSNNTGLLAIKLHTGRTHQIRVHLGSIGRHILGDDTYGFKGKKSRVYLHAYILYLKHPRTNEHMQIVAPLFCDMQEYLNNYFNKGEINDKTEHQTLIEQFSACSFAS